MIQESINQLITTAGLAGRLSPNFETRQEAEKIKKKGLAAEKGLQDISKSIEKVKSGKNKPYSESELKDISARIGEHVSNIGALKTGAIEGMPTAKYLKKAKAQLQPRNEYSEMLTGIEKSLSSMREKAMENMKNKANAAVEQDEQFKALRKSLMRLDDPYKLMKNPFELEDKDGEK